MSVAFKVGDRVTQTYQTGGSHRQRDCIVVTEVGVYESPQDACAHAGVDYETLRFTGTKRNHVSYVVSVGSKLYWPRVSQLRPVVDSVDDGQIAIALTLAKGYARLAIPSDAEHAAEVLAAEVERLRALLGNQVSR